MPEARRQRTLRGDIKFNGVGLHTGRKCQAVFKPAPANSGIVFIRTDLRGAAPLPARIENVVDVVRGTTLGIGDARVYTIEHVLSALHGLGVDNLVVEMDNSEPPVADGSAKEFAEAIDATGTVEQDAPKKFFSVTEPFEYQSNNTVIRIEPADALEIECEIDYDHPMLSQQKLIFRESDNYRTEIAPARTFCFDYEIEALHKNGLAKGGSLDNAIVIGPSGIHNPGNALRFKDEFVRHKILDLMGDLMLIGSPLRARVVARRCGHGHNVKFLKQLLERPSSVTRSLHVG